MDSDDDGLLNIEISDSEDVDEKKARRTGQSETEFQAVKSGYRAKIQNGNIYESIVLPVTPSSTKMELQEIIHAAEELYFFRRYQDVIQFVDRVFSDGGKEALDDDTRHSLQQCRVKSSRKLNAKAPPKDK